MVGEHSSKQYDLDLESIRSRVLLMGGLVETHFQEAVDCLRSSNAQRAEQVMQSDGAVNQLEVILDEACSNLIVKRQPAANDLRAVMATIKVITDLERIGDESTKIARSAKRMADYENSGINSHEMLKNIAKNTSDLLHDALDAFARLDEKTAVELIARDKVIDTEFRALMRTLVDLMGENPLAIPVALETLWAVKSIERIGDHAKNIAEYVIFVVEGTDIRHGNLSQRGEQLA
jgi:phosphate transport system protein